MRFFAVALGESLGYGECAAVGADVFAHEEDALVLIEGFAENG